MTTLLNAITVGLAIGAVYGLIALGYTVIYTSTHIVNLAQGDLVMVGVLVSYFLLVDLHWSQVVVFLAVVACVALIAAVEELTVIRPFMRQAREGSNLGWLIATLAVSLIIEAIAQIRYGQNPVRAVPSFLPAHSLRIGSLHIQERLLVPIGVLLIASIALDMFYTRTWRGASMKAAADDRELAAIRGMSPNGISLTAFVISGVLAGAGGFAIAPVVYADPTIGLTYGIKGFIAVAVGGFGNLRGAVVGALGLGVVEQVFDSYVNAQYQDVSALLLLLVVLAVRPSGLFGVHFARTV